MAEARELSPSQLPKSIHFPLSLSQFEVDFFDLQLKEFGLIQLILLKLMIGVNHPLT